MTAKLGAMAAALALALVPVVSLAGAEERKFIQAGMSEAEVLIKIGKPDSKSYDSGGGAVVNTVRWIYMPTKGDEQTVTTVVIREGKVVSVSREVIR